MNRKDDLCLHNRTILQPQNSIQKMFILLQKLDKDSTHLFTVWVHVLQSFLLQASFLFFFLFRLSQGDTRDLTDEDMKCLERFVILMYDRSSQLTDVNECRKILFARKGRSIDNLPPTRGALLQHAKRALLQGG